MNCWILLLLLCGCGSNNGGCGHRNHCNNHNCIEPRDTEKRCDDRYEKENRWSPYRNNANCEHHEHDNNNCDCDR